jgi:hypothetical protein
MQAGGKKGYMGLHYDTDDNLTFQKANGMGFSMQKGEKRTNEYTQKKTIQAMIFIEVLAYIKLL